MLARRRPERTHRRRRHRRGPALRPPPAGGPRLHDARHVRRAVRRSNRAAARSTPPTSWRSGPRGYGFLASGLELGSVLAAFVMLALPPVRRTGLALIWAVVGSRSRPSCSACRAPTRCPWSPTWSPACRTISRWSCAARRSSSRRPTSCAAASARSTTCSSAPRTNSAPPNRAFVAAATSPTFSVVSGGVGALVVAILVAWLNPTLRRYRAHEPERAANRKPLRHHQVVARQEVGRVGGNGRVPTSRYPCSPYQDGSSRRRLTTSNSTRGRPARRAWLSAVAIRVRPSPRRWSAGSTDSRPM